MSCNPTILTEHDYLELTALASVAKRRRAHRVLSSPESPVQRLIAGIAPDSYSRPHRFPGDQTIAVLWGAIWLLTWSAAHPAEMHRPRRLIRGDVVDLMFPSRYHAIVAARDGAVILETLRGPYDPSEGGVSRREELDGWPPELERGGTEADAGAGLARLRADLASWGCRS